MSRPALKPKKKAVAKAKRSTAKEQDRKRVEQAAAAEAMGDELTAVYDAAASARKRGR